MNMPLSATAKAAIRDATLTAADLQQPEQTRPAYLGQPSRYETNPAFVLGWLLSAIQNSDLPAAEKESARYLVSHVDYARET